MTRLPLAALALATLLATTACKSDEEKAEELYRSALGYMEEGETERALVQLRNVFNLDGFHRDARALYAETVLEQGNSTEAYSQLLRLVEQYPDDVPSLLTLAELALDAGSFDEVERHGSKALALAPEEPRARAIGAAIAYRAAVLDNDADGSAAAVEEARAVLATAPGNLPALQVLIDATLRGRTPTAALPLLEEALAERPLSLQFNLMKLQLLGSEDDDAATLAQLRHMFDTFPDNTDIQGALVNWYLGHEDMDSAEAVLRQLADGTEDPTAGVATLVQFLRQTTGPEAAMAELDTRITAAEGAPQQAMLRAMRAVLAFETGETEAAIAEMEALTAAAEPSDETRRIEALLARMYVGAGNQVGARALVEKILGEDATHVDALKMRAAWAIEDDRPDAAINDLRAALSQAPRDADLHTLMADAYLRAGNRDLAGESLSQAVQVSSAAPAYALRYVDFLVATGRGAAAEQVLLDSRRGNPADLEVLAKLADRRIQDQNWIGVQEVLSALNAIGTEDSRALAGRIEAAALIGQNRVEDGLALLQGQLSATQGPDVAAATVVLAQIRGGQLEEARAALDEALAANPDSLALRTLDGSLLQVMEKPEEAEAVLRGVLAEDPGAETPTRLLYAQLRRESRAAEASELLDAALAVQPDNPNLAWMKAGELEQAEDIDGAIAIYEDLYARMSGNVIVANNLASLIATYRDDAESLERAWAIARRLKEETEPAFQDTYGWIAFRRGDAETAVGYLEPAAAGLPNDPTVQVHLGLALAALGRNEAAAIALARGLEIAGDSALPQFEAARAALAALPAADAAPDGDGAEEAEPEDGGAGETDSQ